MLSLIKIQNIALIPSVEINFGEKFNVRTGETGAGKSIIIGSLNFIFGDKLSVSAIRGGADFAKVTSVFNNCNIGENGSAFLGTENPTEIIITRVLRKDGRSEIRINDEIISIKALKEFASNLIDIHGQHDTEKLLSPKNHIDILDAFGHIDITAYRTQYNKLIALKTQLADFGDNDTERERLIDLYRYQTDEIERANLSATEETELEQKISVLRNSRKITDNMGESIGALNTADSEITHAIKKIGAIAGYDENLGELNGRLGALGGELTDIIISAKSYLENADFNDTDIDAVGERLENIKNLKRKYGKTVDEIFEFLSKTKAEYDRLIGATEKIAELKAEIEKQTAVVLQYGEKLSAVRKAQAETMQTELLRHICDLGMPNAQFVVGISTKQPQPNGTNEIEFYFSANLGESVKPLSKIISGGEMSRLMLCIKTIANLDKEKTLVFDEIDTGISGAMGIAVAKKLSQLSKHNQIIVVTHLAGISAMADTHFLIEKSVTDNKTVTAVMPLNQQQRIDEIARIVGGNSETAIAHAKSLLKM
jgi:DNA repair protein RecN (Recombination protein N)